MILIKPRLTSKPQRRQLLFLALAAVCFLVAVQLRADTANTRTLSFHSLHTGESLTSVYWQNGDYVQAELKAINHILRDHRVNETHAIDPKLLDILYQLQQLLKTDQPFHIISGYRSPATNAKLRASGRGVAKNSMHTRGRAIDIRIPGVKTADLRKAALSLKLGGVGYYAKSAFVHVDTGRVRTW